jgi:hypothetical protein
MPGASTKQNRWGQPMQHNLTELEAFDAMRAFLEAYWRRGLCASDGVANLLSNINREIWSDGGPGDPAQWNNWLDAIETSQKTAKP